MDVDVDLLDARAGGGAGRGICAMGVLRRRSRHLDVATVQRKDSLVLKHILE